MADNLVATLAIPMAAPTALTKVGCSVALSEKPKAEKKAAWSVDYSVVSSVPRTAESTAMTMADS